MKGTWLSPYISQVYVTLLMVLGLTSLVCFFGLDLAIKQDDWARQQEEYDAAVAVAAVASHNEDQEPQDLLDDSNAPGSEKREHAAAAASCAVCTESEIESVFEPCNHACCCVDCARALARTKQSCPVCRQPIAALKRIYITGYM